MIHDLLRLAVAIGTMAACAALFSISSSAAERPLVYAHYMHCYILGGMADSIGNDQGPKRDVTVPPDQWPERENVDRVWWSARLAPRVQEGLPAVETDFSLGDAAGLDAFGLLIGDNHLPNSQFAHGMRLAAQAAQKSRVKIMPDLWGDFPNLDAVGERKYGANVKAFMDAYPGAFLKREGRWVISLGCPIGYGKAHDNFVEWDRVRPFFDPWGGPQHFYIIVNTTWDSGDLKTGWGSAADAISMWTAPFGWGDRAPKGPDCLFDYASTYGKQVAWPIHSDYFGGRKGCESMAECLGASTFTDMWREAIHRRSAFAAIQTWNDFSEDHAITEANYRGDSLILLNRYFSEWFHKGSPPRIRKERVFLFHHRQLCSARLSASTILAHNDSWHSTPTVDYLNVVTLLNKPAHVELTDGTTTWGLDAPLGLHEWLVYVPSSRSEAGPHRIAFTHADGSSYPVTSPFRTVDPVSSIAAGAPSVRLTRNGQTLVSLSSHLPLSDRAKWQDLATVADNAEF